MRPLVSVLMSVYNCEKYIVKALSSILNQSYSNLEILVCDDCSGDRSKMLIHTFNDKRIRFFENKKKYG